jgi:uncharacterized membrane protein YdfJ with MMPL/SSD domain
VSLIEEIRGELAGMGAQIESAQNTAAEAEEAAGEIEERATAAGFTGIADGMSQVRDAVQEVRSLLSSAGDQLGQAHAPVDSAPQKTSPEEAAGALSPATQSLGGVYETVAASIDQVDDVQRLVSAVLDGGEPGPMLSRLDSIKQDLEQTVSRCDAAKRRVESALAEVRHTGAEAG